MVGYKHPCRYCDNLVPTDAQVCPMCGKVNPTGPLRCPNCRSPIRRNWKVCSHCGLGLHVKCPKCRRSTFLGDYCTHCDARLAVECPNGKCNIQQPPGDFCNKCGTSLK